MITIDWARLITLDYWLEGLVGDQKVTPLIQNNGFIFWFFISLFTGIAVIAIVAKVSRAFIPKEHPLQSKIPWWSDNYLWMGILGITWLILRQIETAFLGSRIWLLVGLLWFGIITYLVIRYFVLYFKLEYAYYLSKKSSVK